MKQADELERLRTAMIERAEQVGVLTDPSVLELSQQLDGLILEAQSHISSYLSDRVLYEYPYRLSV